MSLEDPVRGVVYIAVSRELFPELGEWSKPVQLKVERDSRGDYDLVVRDVDYEEDPE